MSLSHMEVHSPPFLANMEAAGDIIHEKSVNT